MKRVFRRSITKNFNTITKVICIIVLCFFIFYLKSHDAIEEKEDVIFHDAESKELFQDIDEHNKKFVAAILVICANRPEALRNHLTQLLTRRPSATEFHVIISQDGSKASVRDVAMQFVREFKNVSFMNHQKKQVKKGNNYPAISAHYKWALDKIFDNSVYKHVVVTEDDLDIGNDFFSYFRWGKQVLDTDSSIWCISAWNDNGPPSLIDPTKNDLVWRTDFFPGLGWMLSKNLWTELSEKFPASYWDDWMRQPSIRKNRSCVRPEISRTSHNMRLAGKGSSGGMFKDFLSKISASSSNTDFTLLPVDMIEKHNYDSSLIEQIKNAKVLNYEDLTLETQLNTKYTFKAMFKNIRDWNFLAKFFKVMTDIRGGMQRTAYYGVVTVMFKGTRVFLVPFPTFQNPDNLTEYQYNADWDKQNRFIEFENYYCRTKKYTGKCDPHSPEMIAFFEKKGWKKRLADWGEMIVV